MTLYVKKSHIGQYIRPFNKVGIRSRFNLAVISYPLSPEIGIANTNQKHAHMAPNLNHFQIIYILN